MNTTQVSVTDFLRIRDHIAALLSRDSQTQRPTRIRQAENLMTAGVIDIEATLESIRPEREDVPEEGQE